MCGDVYRRDAIDATHYPVFHQLDAVRLKTASQLFDDPSLNIFENGKADRDKQNCHTLEACKLMEHELKTTLEELARQLFGGSVPLRWVTQTFPFTYPSWELEILHKSSWMEVLGCGIMKQPILANSGVMDKIGWAFGLGLERLAMILYQIPDIRLFWSRDSGFLSQFKTDDISRNIVYKPISQYPQCANDISFWLPKEVVPNDFYDLVRSVGGDVVEQVNLIDEFTHPKSGKRSQCYRIVYRHMERNLTQAEVNTIHKRIEETATDVLGVTIR